MVDSRKSLYLVSVEVGNFFFALKIKKMQSCWEFPRLWRPFSLGHKKLYWLVNWWANTFFTTYPRPSAEHNIKRVTFRFTTFGIPRKSSPSTFWGGKKQKVKNSPLANFPWFVRVINNYTLLGFVRILLFLHTLVIKYFLINSWDS